MNFTYQAKDLAGESHQGEIESVDIHGATSILRKKGLIVISLSAKNTSSNPLDKFLNKVSFADLVTTTRQLATMISAGLVLSEALDILVEQQSNSAFKKVLEEVSHDIKGGLTLAQALGKHPQVFPSIYINLVASGESSGTMDKVLVRMADNLEKEREFQARVKGALIYPVVVIVMMMAVVVMMMVFVIPKLTSLYSQSSLDLPLPTKILIAASSFMVNFWWVLMAALLGAFFALRRWRQTVGGKMTVDVLLLKIPIVGKIITNVSLSNFSRTFGMLVAAGIPLLNAIKIVEDVTDNGVFKNALRGAYIGVERGLSFSALLLSPVFPRLIGQMVRVGEETGKLDEVFFKLADYFESEADHMVKNLTVAIEPIILIILGIGVGFLVISIILPIYNLTSNF